MTASPATVRAAAASLGPVAPPMIEGEPVFAEPWEGRAYGLALALVERRSLPWSSFRDRLIAAISEQPERPYFESWIVALERLAADEALVDADVLRHERSDAGAYRYVEAGDEIEVVPLIHPASVLIEHFGTGIVDESVRHVEMYRYEKSGSPPRCGVRSFDAAADIIVDLAIPGGEWEALRDSLLSFATDSPPA